MKIAQLSVGLVIAIIFHGYTSFGQGTVNFSNLGGNDSQKVYLNTVGGPLAPAGTTYSLGLYWAPDGVTDEEAFVMVGTSTGIIGLEGTPSGLFSGGTRNVPVTPASGPAMLQVRAWSSAFGSSFEEAAASGAAALGKSPIIRVDTGDPGSPASILAAGFTGFAIAVPEPSTYALAGVGVGLFLVLRRLRR